MKKEIIKYETLPFERSFAERCKYIRRQLNISQRELANKLKTNQTKISLIEVGGYIVEFYLGKAIIELECAVWMGDY